MTVQEKSRIQMLQKRILSGLQETPKLILNVQFKDIFKTGKLLENHLDSLFQEQNCIGKGQSYLIQYDLSRFARLIVISFCSNTC